MKWYCSRYINSTQSYDIDQIMKNVMKEKLIIIHRPEDWKMN